MNQQVLCIQLLPIQSCVQSLRIGCFVSELLESFVGDGATDSLKLAPEGCALIGRGKDFASISHSTVLRGYIPRKTSSFLVLSVMLNLKECPVLQYEIRWLSWWIT